MSRATELGGAGWRSSKQASHTIIANVGDQPSDLAGGYAKRALLTDPFYRIP